MTKEITRLIYKSVKKKYNILIDSLFLLYFKLKPRNKRNNSNKLLIIRLDGIGDSILFNYNLSNLSVFFSKYEIDIIVRNYVKDLYRKCPYIKTTIPINIVKANNNIFYRFKVLNDVYKNDYKVVLYPMLNNNFLGDLICKIFETKTIYKLNEGLELNINKRNGILKEIDRYRIYTEKITGLKIINRNEKFWIPRETQVFMDNFINENISNEYLVIFPGSAGKLKLWKLENWRAVVQELLQFKLKIICLGGPEEVEMCDFICSDFDEDRVKNYCAKFNLNELVVIIKNAKLYIGMDTGAVHMAAATNTPVVCLIGGGHFGRFFPYGDLNKNRIVNKFMDCYNCDWKCIYSSAKCIDEIEVNDVLKEVNFFLS